MKCSNILNYLSIPICFLNAIVLSTNDDTGLGGLTFEDPDNYWPMIQQHSPTHSNENYSELFNTQGSPNSSRQPEPSNIELPSTMNDIEEAFINLNRWNPLPWNEVEDNDTTLLQRICFAVWPDDIPGKKCESQAFTFRGCNRTAIRVELITTKSLNERLGANLLKCKCYPNSMRRDRVKSQIQPIYLAKHNDLSVFLLTNIGGKTSNKLMITGMMPLNLTDIISSKPSIMPPNRTSSPLTWNLTEAEKEYYIMFNNFTDAVKWQAIRDVKTDALDGICIAAWDDSSDVRCYARPRPYTNPKCNGLRAVLEDCFGAVSVRADLLQCRCSSNKLLYFGQIRDEIEPIYYAKYNSTTVFKLIMDGDYRNHNLKFVTSTNDTWLGRLIYEDHENDSSITLQNFPSHSNENHPEFFNTHTFHESSRHLEPAVTSNIKLPSTTSDIENTFIKLNLWNPLPWKEVEDNDTVLLQKICFSAWPVYILDKKCESEARPYKGSDKSRLKVELSASESNIELLGANMLRCRCHPNNMKRAQVTSEIKPLYLAKHDNLSVFILKHNDYGNPCRLKMIGMMPLNLTDIISTKSSVKPPYRTSSPLTWNLTETEKEFYIMYNNFSDHVKWQAIRDGDTRVLKRICIAAREDSSYKRCHTQPRPYSDPKRNGMKVKLADDYDAINVRADFLLCKCSSNDLLNMLQIRVKINPIYFAKYNSTTLFELITLGDKHSHNLKVLRKKILLNMTI